jgi:hypothetical protein
VLDDEAAATQDEVRHLVAWLGRGFTDGGKGSLRYDSTCFAGLWVCIKHL